MALRTAAQNGNFTTGSTWVGGVAPSGSDTFEIPAGLIVTLSASATIVFSTGGMGICGTLALSGSASINGGSCSINFGGALSLTDDTTLNGDAQTINSGGTLSLSGFSGIVSGTQTVNSGGVINLSGNSLVGGGSITVTSGGTLELSGDAYLDGGAHTINSGGTISFSGNSGSSAEDAGDGDGSVLIARITLSAGAIFKNMTGLSQLVQLTDSTKSGAASPSLAGLGL